MDPWDWLAIFAGVGIVVLTVGDVWITIFHKDRQGLASGRVHRWIWKVIVAASRRFPTQRRSLLALAGPFLIFVTIVTWMACYIVGFSLIVWPMLDGYRADAELDGEALGFLDALYFSGGTATVLGYGDISPAITAGKMVAVVEAGLGFVIVTSVITYLLNVLNGSTARSALALQVHGETGDTGDGCTLVIESAVDEGAAVLITRILDLTKSLREIEEIFHQFPIVDFYYRSRQATHDSEFLLRAVGEAALAAYLISLAPRFRQVRPAARHLNGVVRDLVMLIASSYMGPRVRSQIMTPDHGRRPQCDSRACRSIRS